jgi:hypothetical protein
MKLFKEKVYPMALINNGLARVMKNKGEFIFLGSEHNNDFYLHITRSKTYYLYIIRDRAGNFNTLHICSTTDTKIYTAAQNKAKMYLMLG